MANGVVVASAAAADRRRQLQEEEEEMTMYSQDELNNYEFKIVRANAGIFGKPAEFNKLIQEEAHSGWELVEKFDNQRVRFKRPISARARDSQLPVGIDPYRTHYGMSQLLFTLLLLLITLLAVGLIFAIIAGIFAVIIAFNLPVP